MKVLIIANPEDPHTIKWITYLSKYGIEIYLFGLNDFDPIIYTKVKNFKYTTCGFTEKFIVTKTGNIRKLSYLKVIPKLRRVIRKIKPDIVHAHYASGNGLLGALSFFKKYVISFFHWKRPLYYL